uniref:Uncharacterized protein n=1 Tax=Arion vulgaris TaxID=1028688 RepID=A0A0B7AWL1_9EUPU
MSCWHLRLVLPLSLPTGTMPSVTVLTKPLSTVSFDVAKILHRSGDDVVYEPIPLNM